MFSFEFFFQNIRDEDFRDEDLSWQPYPEALKQFNELDFDECFGYATLLGLGGAEKVENLKKVKLKEHIIVIKELIGPVE
ncbi:DUF1851 domain-containing protein [Metabacillus indicus]|uniref:DUF1851 domain-containing protein n=1 Tax=Metabacillus indicus TaxID=246786 RepID=UPI001F170D39|nr:DUF1851 domain-containing protein [Metabacillus indicus]